MELNETGLFGIAAISEDLSSAKSLCLGKYQSILETVFRFILNFFFHFHISYFSSIGNWAKFGSTILYLILL